MTTITEMENMTMVTATDHLKRLRRREQRQRKSMVMTTPLMEKK